MQHYLTDMVKHMKNMDRFSVAVIYHSLQLVCGLYAMALLFLALEGTFGNYITVISCYKGALDTAPAVLIAALAAAFICDIAVKDRQSDRT
ncbi:MAG TPA: hypothetical protein VHR42_05520 [Clostridia bacterium]|nr:hypothetical protein [Clostridia bacterium]